MPRLYGKNLVLREYRKDDLPYIAEFVHDYNVTQYLSDLFLRNHTFRSAEHFLEKVLSNESNDRLYFVIAEKETLEYIGQIDLVDIDWVARVGKLGIVISREEFRDSGFGKEAILLLLDYAFRRANLNRVELDVHSFNERAINCYTSCGFVEEGRQRERVFRDNRYYDRIIMGILKREYLSSETER